MTVNKFEKDIKEVKQHHKSNCLIMHFQFEACPLDAFCIMQRLNNILKFILKTWQNYCYSFDIPGKNTIYNSSWH